MTKVAGPGIWLPPPVILLSVLALAFLLDRLVPLPRITGPVGLVAGWACVAFFLCMEGGCFMLFVRAHTNPMPFRPASALVRAGPYRYSRNPMYAGGVALYLGISLLLGLVWGVLLTPLLAWVIQLYAIRREEAYLERTFGDEYRRYKGEVRRWI